MTASAKMRQELAEALSGRLTAWRGLWASETVERLLDMLQSVVRIHPPIASERENRRFHVTLVERSAPPVRIQLWCLDDQPHVTLLEYDDPLINDIEATLQNFGVPEWTLEDKRFAPASLVTEYIYAGRGITISIATPDTGATQGARRAIHVQLYAPESVEDYLASIGADAVLVPEGRNPTRDLQVALAGRLADWRGLIGIETIKTVSDALQSLKEAHPMVESERMTKRFRRSVFECYTPPLHIEAWVLCNQEHLTLVEYDDPVLQDLEESLQILGTPELVLENKRTAESAYVKELVYAGRGITLSIAEPYRWSKMTSRRAVHVQLYRGSSVDYYWRYIGPGPQLRPIHVKTAK
jgi:hypothetical protein